MIQLLRESYQYRQSSSVSNLISYSFQIDQNIDYEVMFEKKRWGDKLIYIISFGSGMDITLPDIDNPIKLIRTVFEIIEEFFEEYDPDGIAYQAKNEKLNRIYLNQIKSSTLEQDFERYEMGRDFVVWVKKTGQ